MMPSSRIHQFKSRLGSLKDRKVKHEPSGIYKVASPDCEKCYYGHKKDLFWIHWAEHKREAETTRRKKKRSITLKSMIAQALRKRQLVLEIQVYE